MINPELIKNNLIKTIRTKRYAGITTEFIKETKISMDRIKQVTETKTIYFIKGDFFVLCNDYTYDFLMEVIGNLESRGIKIYRWGDVENIIKLLENK